MRWRVRATRLQAAAFNVPSLDKGGDLVPDFPQLMKTMRWGKMATTTSAIDHNSDAHYVHFFSSHVSMWWRLTMHSLAVQRYYTVYRPAI